MPSASTELPEGALAPPGTPVGFIGLGSMGGAIAQQLAGAVTLHVFDARPEAAAPLVAAGATSSTLEEIGESCRVILTCLPTSEDVEHLLTENGLAALLQPGSLLVDMTSGSPDVDRRIMQLLDGHDVGFADAPVSGGPRGAQQGTLCIMVGADDASFARVAPILRHVTEKVVHVGPSGSGHVMKLVNNFVAATNRLVASEGVAMAVKHGIPLRTCLEVLGMSSGGSYLTDVTLMRIADEGQVAPHGFKLGLGAKDVRLARALYEGSGLPSWFVEQTDDLLARAVAEFGGDSDMNAVERWYGNFGLESTT
jgi:3-hydroxyisobutyrate dehydrogenase